MSWEESRRKEQVFRKAKTNREVILKTVEDADGNINLKFAIKDNEASTELTLTLDEWDSIITFLNKTSSTIIEEINKKIGKSIKDSSIKPLTEYIQPEKAEPSMIPKAEPVKVPASQVITEIRAEPVKVPAAQVITELKTESIKMPLEEMIVKPEAPIASEVKMKVDLSENKSIGNSISALIPEAEKVQGQEPEKPLVVKPIPVDSKVFDELADEIQKISPIQASEGLKTENAPTSSEIKPSTIPEETEIPEKPLDNIFSEPQKVPVIEAETQTLSIDSFDIKQVLDLLNKAQEAPKPVIPEEPVKELADKKEPILPPPIIPKVPEPSKEQLEALLTPIKQPKISIIEKLDNPSPPQIEKIATSPAPSQKPESIEIPVHSKVEATELLEDSNNLLDISLQPLPTAPKPSPIASIPEFEPIAPPLIETPSTPVTLEKEDEQLTTEQKEARIISAMEEVAALMPPGPAKKFVEEMMLKRAEKSDMDKPRVPKLNNLGAFDSEGKQNK